MARRRAPAAPKKTATKKKAATPTSAAFILERSLLGGIAGLVPLPIVDDLLARRARRSLLADVAKRAGLEVAPDVLAALCESPSVSHVASAGTRLLGRALRGATLPLRLLDRARGALVSFQRATLLDHYARHHHAGGALSTDDAKALRTRMDAAISGSPFASLRGIEAHSEALRSAFDRILGA